MPKRPGIHDDDTLGRLADIERRLDDVEAASAPKSLQGKPKD